MGESRQRRPETATHVHQHRRRNDHDIDSNKEVDRNIQKNTSSSPSKNNNRRRPHRRSSSNNHSHNHHRHRSEKFKSRKFYQFSNVNEGDELSFGFLVVKVGCVLLLLIGIVWYYLWIITSTTHDDRGGSGAKSSLRLPSATSILDNHKIKSKIHQDEQKKKSEREQQGLMLDQLLENHDSSSSNFGGRMPIEGKTASTSQQQEMGKNEQQYYESKKLSAWDTFIRKIYTVTTMTNSSDGDKNNTVTGEVELLLANDAWGMAQKLFNLNNYDKIISHDSTADNDSDNNVNDSSLPPPPEWLTSFQESALDLHNQFNERYGLPQKSSMPSSLLFSRLFLSRLATSFPSSTKKDQSRPSPSKTLEEFLDDIPSDIKQTAHRFFMSIFQNRPFTMVFTGTSSTLGHGNYHAQAYPFVVKNLLEDPLEKLRLGWLEKQQKLPPD